MLRPEDIKLEDGVGHLSLDGDLDSKENKCITAGNTGLVKDECNADFLNLDYQPRNIQTIHIGLREFLLSFGLTDRHHEDEHLIGRKALEELRQFTFTAMFLLNKLLIHSGLRGLVVPVAVRTDYAWFIGVNFLDFISEFEEQHGLNSIGIGALNQIIKEHMANLVIDLVLMMRRFLNSGELKQFPWPMHASFYKFSIILK